MLPQVFYSSCIQRCFEERYARIKNGQAEGLENESQIFVLFDRMKEQKILIAALLCSLSVFSQSNVQMGAYGTSAKTRAIGLEIVDNFQAAKNLSIGFGIRPVAFFGDRKLYLPVFATIKYYYTLNKCKLFAGIDPGYGIYPSQKVPYIAPDFYRNSGFYISGGVGIMGTSVLAPYASVHFANFGFTDHYGSSAQYNPVSTFTLSAGLMLNRVPDSYSRIRGSVAMQGGDEYYKKSKKQRNAGRIWLGAGLTLIGSSILIASNSNDPMAKGLSIAFIGGLGAVSSLVSIPLFASSERNKRKMVHPLQY